MVETAGVESSRGFAILRGLFRAHSEWFGPWTDTFFRFQTLDFPLSKDVLSGQGARQHGGRWNPPGFPAVYGSTTDTTALEECKANDRYYGVVTKGPRLVVAIEAHLTRMVDLTNPLVRRKMGLTLTDLAAEEWRKLLSAGKESLTEAIGRAVWVEGGSGLLARSAAVLKGVNVVVFPRNCVRDRLEVVEGEKLKKLGVCTRA